MLINEKTLPKKAAPVVNGDSSESETNDVDDSDIEIIETIAEVVVLDDEDDDDSGDEEVHSAEAPDQPSVGECLNADVSPMTATTTVIAAPGGTSRSESFSHMDTDEDVLALQMALNNSLEAVHDFDDDSGGEEPPPPGTSEAVVILPSVIETNAQAQSAAPAHLEAPPHEAVSRIDVVTPLKSIHSWADIVKGNTPNTLSASANTVDEPTLFYDDKHGSIDHPLVTHVPLYEPVSDDSFICDRTLMRTPQRRKETTISTGAEPVSDDSFICDQTLTPCERGADEEANEDEEVENDVGIISLDETIIAKPATVPTTATQVVKPGNADIIDLDDTLFASPAQKRRRKRKAAVDDDSVIFVSETVSAVPSRSAANFVPISNKQAKKAKLSAAVVALLSPKRSRAMPYTGASTSNRSGLVTNAQNPRVFQRTIVNNRPQPVAPGDVCNTYNPSKVDTSKAAKRMVIIDGSNVAYRWVA